MWIRLDCGAILSCSSCFAQTDPQGILQDYATASTNWQNAIAPYAYNLFKLLAAVDLAWTCIVVALEKQDMQGVVATIIKKLMTIGYFLDPSGLRSAVVSAHNSELCTSWWGWFGQAYTDKSVYHTFSRDSYCRYLFNGAAASNLLLFPLHHWL